MPVLLDSFDQIPTDSGNIFNGDTTKAGDTFTPAISANLGSVQAWLSKSGSPTGNAVAKVYAITGTPGTSGVPTGAALATSDNVDVSTISTSFGFVTFTFSGGAQISLSSGTYYTFTVEYSGGDSSNKLRYQLSTNSLPADKNCFDNFSGSFAADPDRGFLFYLYDTSTTLVKTRNGLAVALIKTQNGLAVASIKTRNGLT